MPVLLNAGWLAARLPLMGRAGAIMMDVYLPVSFGERSLRLIVRAEIEERGIQIYLFAFLEISIPCHKLSLTMLSMSLVLRRGKRAEDKEARF